MVRTFDTGWRHLIPHAASPSRFADCFAAGNLIHPVAPPVSRGARGTSSALHPARRRRGNSAASASGAQTADLDRRTLDYGVTCIATRTIRDDPGMMLLLLWAVG